jgi:archaellum component FlaC
MNKREIVKELQEVVRGSIGMEDSPKSDFLRNGIKKISKELEREIESTNDKIVGNLSLSIDVDSREANRQIEILGERLDMINQQIDRAVEELENTRSKIKIGVEVNE